MRGRQFLVRDVRSGFWLGGVGGLTADPLEGFVVAEGQFAEAVRSELWHDWVLVPRAPVVLALSGFGFAHAGGLQ